MSFSLPNEWTSLHDRLICQLDQSPLVSYKDIVVLLKFAFVELRKSEIDAELIEWRLRSLDYRSDAFDYWKPVDFAAFNVITPSRTSWQDISYFLTSLVNAIQQTLNDQMGEASIRLATRSVPSSTRMALPRSPENVLQPSPLPLSSSPSASSTLPVTSLNLSSNGRDSIVKVPLPTKPLGNRVPVVSYGKFAKLFPPKESEQRHWLKMVTARLKEFVARALTRCDTSIRLGEVVSGRTRNLDEAKSQRQSSSIKSMFRSTVPSPRYLADTPQNQPPPRPNTPFPLPELSEFQPRDIDRDIIERLRSRRSASDDTQKSGNVLNGISRSRNPEGGNKRSVSSATRRALRSRNISRAIPITGSERNDFLFLRNVNGNDNPLHRLKRSHTSPSTRSERHVYEAYFDNTSLPFSMNRSTYRPCYTCQRNQSNRHVRLTSTKPNPYVEPTNSSRLPVPSLLPPSRISRSCVNNSSNSDIGNYPIIIDHHSAYGISGSGQRQSFNESQSRSVNLPLYSHSTVVRANSLDTSHIRNASVYRVHSHTHDPLSNISCAALPASCPRNNYPHRRPPKPSTHCKSAVSAPPTAFSMFQRSRSALRREPSFTRSVTSSQCFAPSSIAAGSSAPSVFGLYRPHRHCHSYHHVSPFGNRAAACDGKSFSIP